MTIVDPAVVATADYPIPSHIPADDVPSHISMNDIPADVSPNNRIAINSSATIEVASTAHPIKGSTMHAGKTAATKSTAATKASTPPSVGIGEKGSKAYQNGEKKYQAELETGFHDTRLPNL